MGVTWAARRNDSTRPARGLLTSFSRGAVVPCRPLPWADGKGEGRTALAALGRVVAAVRAR